MITLAIVGGGAAGIGAALAAKRRGIEALLLEASDRLGGRARTIDWHGHKLDLGCGWLHSAERNCLRVEAERRGIEVDRTKASWLEQFRDLGFTPEDQAEAWQSFEALEERLREAPPSSDRASDALEPGNRWNAWLDAISGYINGAPLRDISVADYLAYDDSSSDQNWRLPGGYGTLVEALGADVEHRPACPVTAIGQRGEAVQIETSDGVIAAEKVIVAVPTATLGKIRFDPPINEAIEAATDLPLGLADKLFLSLEHAEEFSYNAHLIGNPRSAETGSYMLRPMGMPVVEAFFGGDGARAIERLSLEGAAAFAVDELASLLGSGVRPRLKPIVRSRWANEQWIGGSYSHAWPGKASARTKLAEAGGDRMAFAGEACSRNDFSTAHGAFDSGAAAITRLFAEP